MRKLSTLINADATTSVRNAGIEASEGVCVQVQNQYIEKREKKKKVSE
jgi:hypothetical protein